MDIKPGQFETLAGRAAAKKWRDSIKVLLPDGSHVAVGKWLEVGAARACALCRRLPGRCSGWRAVWHGYRARPGGAQRNGYGVGGRARAPRELPADRPSKPARVAKPAASGAAPPHRLAATAAPAEQINAHVDAQCAPCMTPGHTPDAQASPCTCWQRLVLSVPMAPQSSQPWLLAGWRP